jgi:glycosyltransferase involved in cell wall biosynthesis
VRSVVVAKFVPWPPNSGDKRRVLGVVRALRERGEVTLCGFTGPDEDAEPLRAEGIEVRSVPLHRTPATLLRGLAVGRSITAARFWDDRLARLVADATSDAPDALLIEHVQLLPYARGARAGIRVLDMHNVESVLVRRMAGSSSGLRRLALLAESRAVRALERRAAGFDAVMVVSEVDRAALDDVLTHPRVLVVPNAWDEPTPLPPAAEPVASFVALLSWGPNIDAAVWFSREVWPLVVHALPEARLRLVGRNPADPVRALAGPTVEVTGTVPDLTPWYASTRVALAPLLAGGGSRLKILEALAAGRPVVATSIGAEGLEDLIGRGVIVADDPARMAAAVVDLLSDGPRSAALGSAGATAVAADHSWAAAVRPLLAALPSGH